MLKHVGTVSFIVAMSFNVCYFFAIPVVLLVMH